GLPATSALDQQTLAALRQACGQQAAPADASTMAPPQDTSVAPDVAPDQDSLPAPDTSQNADEPAAQSDTPPTGAAPQQFASTFPTSAGTGLSAELYGELQAKPRPVLIRRRTPSVLASRVSLSPPATCAAAIAETVRG